MRMLITAAVIVTSLALAGASAMAAGANVHKTARTHVAQAHAAVHTAARQRYPHYTGAPYYSYRAPYNVGQIIQSVLGGPLPPQYAPIVRNAGRGSASHRSSGSYESSGSYDSGPSPSPSPDLSPPPAGPDTAGMNTATNPTWGALQ